jgi:hypothetical protein
MRKTKWIYQTNFSERLPQNISKEVRNETKQKDYTNCFFNATCSNAGLAILFLCTG